MQLQKILVPIDFSPPSRSALHHAIVLSRQCRASLTLLYVAEPSTALAQSLPDEIVKIERRHVAEAHRLLDAVVAPDDRHCVDLRTVVKSGEAAEEIIS